MSRRTQLLNDEQWAKIEALLPKEGKALKRGRPSANDRTAIEGILWGLRTGARWKDLPGRYPSQLPAGEGLSNGKRIGYG